MPPRRVSGIDPRGVNVELDRGVMEALPNGCRVLKTSPGGMSLWVETLKIEVELPDGSRKAFFKKGATGPVGWNMMKGAFESESALYSFIPEHVPKPVAYGSYQSHPDMHFYIAEHVEMVDDHPNAEAYADVFLTLHSRSMGKSPNGKFGFHINTHLADIPQDNTWNSSWEGFWGQAFRSLCEKEEAARGPDDDLTRLKEVFHQLVIPRYLRPLESDGRVVHPVLLHNDGWPGNIMHKETSDGPLCLFDSAAFWGHNEVDIRATRPGTWKLEEAGKIYKALMKPSEPEDDYCWRVELYATLGFALRSTMYPGVAEKRKLLMEQMEMLANRALASGAMRALPALGQADAPTAGATGEPSSVGDDDRKVRPGEATPLGQGVGSSDGITKLEKDAPAAAVLMSMTGHQSGLWQRSLSIIWPLASWFK